MAGKKNEYARMDEEEQLEQAAADAQAAMDAEEEEAALEREMQYAEEAAKGGFSNPAQFLAAELERVEAERNELRDNYLRAHAEMENLRRRTAKDVSDARQYSVAGFAREMLAVADNLRRALDAVPEEAREKDETGFSALIEGVEMTERSMMQALEKHGVKKISPHKERFDPNFHQAMFEVQDDTVPNNTVLQVVQDGFVIGERCLRPAMVGVAKGGPKISKETPAEAEAEAAGDQ